MKKQLLSLAVLWAAAWQCVDASNFVIDNKKYQYDIIERKDVGPGVTYTRLRVPDYPLNINYMTVDLSNPYNRIETQQATETLGSTEKLATAYARMQSEGKKPIGGQNGNFWVVATQPLYEDFCMGATYNGNLKNGQIITETNCYSDQWDGGPTRTGVVGIDTDKKLWIESMSWKGTVESARWGSEQRPEIIQVNKFCRASGEMTLYNSFYGRTKAFKTIENQGGKWSLVDGKTCEVYLNLDSGEQWGVASDFTATVMAVKTNQAAGTLGNYDMCLAGTASYKTLLEQLKPGDKVTINYGWISAGNGATPKLENLIGGNAIVLKDGELTGRNDDEAYNTSIYSRSAYGMSKDGKTLYMFVIDKSTDPEYGTSAGCTTSVMSQILKQLGAWNVCNVDAGGSAQLMVRGEVVNKTTESAPRAVANGWMVYSTAPETDDSKVVARLAFLDNELKIPVYATYRPVVLGYNKYGELIDDDVEGFSLSCEGGIGQATGSEFFARGETISGKLTAKLGEVSVTKELEVVSSPVEVRLPNILIDGRDYRIEVVAKNGFSEYNCDSSRFDWTVGDESVATISLGVLKALKNGATTISGTIGGNTTTANVVVEIPESDFMPVYRQFPTDWNLKQSGGSGLAISQQGEGFNLNFTGNGSGRGAYIQIESECQIYSLPSALRLSINPGDATVKGISLYLENGLGDRKSAFVITDKEVAKNAETTFDVQLSDWFDVDDIGNYPLKIYSMRLDMAASEKGKNFEIRIPRFEACYNGIGSVDEIDGEVANVRVYPNPVAGGVLNVASSDGVNISKIEVFDYSGRQVESGDYDSSVCTLDVGGLSAGIYFVKVVTECGISVQKVIVR